MNSGISNEEPDYPGSRSKPNPAAAPFFSIVVPTRNRPGMLRRALQSIAAQSFTDYEAIVVDDGSGSENVAALRELGKELGARFVLLERDAAEPRHGPNVARNAGIARARGEWVAFLDDDDYWCDPAHLEQANRCLSQRPGIDLYLANQVARRGDDTVVAQWLPYVERVAGRRRALGTPDCRELQRADLLQPEGIGFAHVNMCIIRREIVQRTGGFWEVAPYEGDLDFFLRLMDHTQTIVYRQSTVSVNTVREQDAAAGVSTLDDEPKLLLRALAIQHAELHCAQADVLRYIRSLHGGVLKTLAKRHYHERRLALAGAFAVRAAAVDPSPRWIAIALAVKLRAWLDFLPCRRSPQ